MDRVTFIKAKI